MALNFQSWQGRRVFLTGHTGFKGGWLSLLLTRLGADVYGYALNPASSPNFFEVADVAESLSADIRGDIRDLAALERALQDAAPDVVFHLAAQPLVVESYANPIETYAVNVMGTVHLLDAVRRVESVRAVVVITTDKCYENREWLFPYREVDALGGRDPYSSSKACAEIITNAYRESFFSDLNTRASVAIATARAGNVIGGGDWAVDRLIPDCIRAFADKRPVQLRYPGAVRPWQHVLEPLVGYLMLAEKLLGENCREYSTAWNFGPNPGEEMPVGEIVKRLAILWGDIAGTSFRAPTLHEASMLRLDINNAIYKLGWKPAWVLDRILEETVRWYRAWHEGEDMAVLSRSQVESYLREAG